MRDLCVRALGPALLAGMGALVLADPGLAQDVEPMALDDTGPAITKLVILLAVFVVVIFAARGFGVGAALRSAVVWIGLAVLLVAGYTYRHDLEQAGMDVVGVLVPGMAVTRGESVTVRRAWQGHFVLEGSVDDAPVTFLFDTGASMVVLAANDAARAGFDPAALDYRVPVETASGRTTVAPVRLGAVTIGGIRVEDVRAAVARPDDLSASLLGMTFLNRLDSYTVSRDTLVLNP